MSSITIRKATLKESSIVADLVLELLKDFNQSGSTFQLDRSKFLSVTEQLMQRENYGAFIASKGNQPVGVLTIAQASAIYNGGDFGVITELYVERTMRSEGIGRQLLDAAFAFARSNRWKKVEVGAPQKEEWPRSFAFYIRNGFVEKSSKLRIELV